MGLKPGDVVASILPNLPESALTFFGCIEAGIIITTVNPIYTAGKSNFINNHGILTII